MITKASDIGTLNLINPIIALLLYAYVGWIPALIVTVYALWNWYWKSPLAK